MNKPSTTWTITAKDLPEEFQASPHAGWKPSSAEKADIRIYPNLKQQEILGFGGAFTEATAFNFSRLGAKNKQRFLEAYFHPEKGNAYRLCRTHIHSCDFALGNYTYVDENDTELNTFSLVHEEKWLFPLLRQAQNMARGTIRLFCSPWSPPAWMKTNGEMNNGGELKPEYRKAWANYYVRYIQEMEQTGFPIWGLTVQNEPAATQIWDSCEYTAEEERDFVRDYLGPALHQAGMADKKLIIWDHNRDIMVERASTVLEDPEAAKYVWGTGFHWYGDDAFENVKTVHDRFPDHHLIFTEGCQEGGPHIGSWDLGERYARSMIHDFNNGTDAWVDWNMLLDIQGGPNHVGNYCSAPILADVENDKLLFQSSYYYMGHFSRFLKPGTHAIRTENSREDILVAGFTHQEEIILVALNLTEEKQDITIATDTHTLTLSLPPRAIGTLVGNLPCQ